MDHTHKTGKLEDLQLAYRLDHSTEMALLKIKVDILENMDNQCMTGILLLDLSAAFNMVSKDILINHLHHWFGITGTALAWINDYLSDRTQKVKISDTESSPAVLAQGVPQGSVLGPILYTLFTSPVVIFARNITLIIMDMQMTLKTTIALVQTFQEMKIIVLLC